MSGYLFGRANIPVGSTLDLVAVSLSEEPVEACDNSL